MGPKPFSDTLRHGGAAAIVDLVGEINGTAETVLQTAYAGVIASDARVVLLNFSAVDYINSTGIALIVGLLVEARRAGRRLLACGLSEHYVEIFEISRLTDFMTMFPDEPSALAGVPAGV